jgi:hypothetical protein
MDWSFAFNPLHFEGANISYCVDSMVTACAQVWGGEDISTTPLLTTVLQHVFHALAEQKLTLLEAQYLIDHRDEGKPMRKYLTERIKDEVIREQWRSWNEDKSSDLRAEFASSTRRLNRFINAEIIRLILGQSGPFLDFRRVMDEGGIVLVNLEPRGNLGEDHARMLGTLIANDLFLKASARQKGSKPFYFYIDECGRYVNESIQRILDESAKRGLHLILANQHLAQLRQAGEVAYGAIMTNTQTKVIFGGLRTEDADTMVKEVFLDLDLEEPKESLTRRVVVGQETVILQSGGSSHSRMDSHTSSAGDGTSENEGESTTMLPDGEEGAVVQSWGVGSSQTLSEAETEAETIAENDGWTETFKNIYDKAIGGHFTLAEQQYKKVAWLKKQPKQTALLVQPDFSLIPFRVATVRPPFVTKKSVDRFTHKRLDALPFVSPRERALSQIEDRKKRLAHEVNGGDEQTEEPDWFGNE